MNFGLLRSTGAAGMVSAAVIAVATALAVIGPTVTPYNPVLPNPEPVLGPAGRWSPARLRLRGPGCAVPADRWRAVLDAGAARGGDWRYDARDCHRGRGGLAARNRRHRYSSGLDILFAFPGILLAVLAAAVFGAGLTAAAIALSIAYMPYVARVLRGAALRERGQPYVAALEVQGASATSICMRHIVPNMLPLIVAQATIMFGWAMVDLAAISFLGLGVQPPAPNWGVMISENQPGSCRAIRSRRWPPGCASSAWSIAFDVLGERLFDKPKRRGDDEEPLLAVDGLTVLLQVEGSRQAVLRDVSLTVGRRAVGLVGESGSGKSMTARAIDRCCLPTPVCGPGPVRGRDLHGWPALSFARSGTRSR